MVADIKSWLGRNQLQRGGEGGGGDEFVRYSFRLDTGINGETVVTMGRRMWEIEKSIIDKRNVNAVVLV